MIEVIDCVMGLVNFRCFVSFILLAIDVVIDKSGTVFMCSTLHVIVGAILCLI